MKQLLFLLLFPCLCMAQYTGNAGQKITLGEQTSADGLVFRGVASIDTVTATSKITRANKQDTSAFILLDTVTNLLWHYKTASNGWIQAGGGVSVSSFSAGTTGLTPSTATTGAVTLGGTLAVANGGTGSATQNFVDLTTTQSSIGGAKTFTSAVTATRFNPTSSTVTGTGMYLPVANTLGFSTNGAIKLLINSHGDLSTNTSSLMTSPWKSFEIGTDVGTMVLAGRTDGVNQLILGTNWTYDGGVAQEFLGSAYSSQYFQTDGNHILRSSSASGSAGADITFNEIARFTKEGNVGIGTASPGYKLDIQSTTDASLLQLISSATANNTALRIGIDGDNSFINASGGSTGILQLRTYGTTRATLDASGAVTINNLIGTGSRAVLADANGVLSAPVSSITTKENVQNLDYGLNEILQVNPVSFDYINKDKWGDERNLGFIVEDIFPVVPEVTGTMNNGDMYLDMTKLIPILTKAIQEQNALIKALEQRILILENK